MTRFRKVKLAAPTLSKGLTTVLLLTVGLGISGCQTLGSGSKNVTCETIKFVYLSRKDTKETIRQVVGNNGALVAICGAPPAFRK